MLNNIEQITLKTGQEVIIMDHWDIVELDGQKYILLQQAYADNNKYQEAVGWLIPIIKEEEKMTNANANTTWIAVDQHRDANTNTTWITLDQHRDGNGGHKSVKAQIKEAEA